MKDLKLSADQIFRYFLSGVIAIFTWKLRCPEFQWANQTTWTVEGLAVGTVLALAIGSLLYSVHRAVIVPLLHRVFLYLFVSRKKTKLFKLVPKSELDFYEKYWNDPPHYSIRPLREWAGYLHFLYCSSWAIYSVLLLAKFLKVNAPAQSALLPVLATVFFVSAVLSNCRLIIIFQNLSSRETEDKPERLAKITKIGFTKRIIGTLEAIRHEIDHDHLESFTRIVRAETFTDLIEQAEHLYNSGYHLAAGVIARAILEEHLRTTCETLDCKPDKARPTINDFNQALYGIQHYTKIKMKQIETLATIGNDAAHNAPTLQNMDVKKLLADLPEVIDSTGV